MAKPRNKAPVQTVDVFCAKCQSQLFRYRKGGKGSLVKCFKQRIERDYTTTPGHCQACGIQFARETLIRGTPAFKLIGGKVWVK